jgi:long-chain acyl-CoA synthetase
VPRLYEAILLALDGRFAGHGRLAGLAWHAAEAAARGLHRAGLKAGRWLFFPLRRRLAPRLRLMVSGGARLEPVTEERLETLGWTVLSGYGLAETASMFTGNLPRARRLGSAGKPLGEGEVRIADPDPEGTGEVQLRGPVVTPGYLDNPAVNAETFTADGWFRTGDLGRLDADGFLFITGRASEILVLGDGKKVDPEPLERLYGAAPGIAEVGLLVSAGKLVALVRPDVPILRERRVVSVRQAVHVALAECAETLPSYKRLAGFAFTEAPLPRTRLGKIRRFLLPRLYADAEAGKTRRAAHHWSDEDRALLEDPRAAATWALLQQRFPDQAIDLDVNLALELNLDSFGRMELAVALQERLGAGLSQEEVAGAATIRDLVRCAAGQSMAPGTSPLPTVALDLDRWLSPTGLPLTIAGAALFLLNRLLMRLAFRLEAQGLERLPAKGGFVMTPNHASDLDPLAVAGAVPFSLARRLYWSGDIVRLFSSTPARLFCRAVHIFPTDEAHAGSAVAAAARVLGAGNVQVWFPEGWRSPDGSPLRFMPGIGQLLLRTDVPAVPVWIDGAFAALPRSRRLPRLHRIRVIFGDPVSVATLREEGEGRSDAERIADGLCQRVLRMSAVQGPMAPGGVQGQGPSREGARRTW